MKLSKKGYIGYFCNLTQRTKSRVFSTNNPDCQKHSAKCWHYCVNSDSFQNYSFLTFKDFHLSWSHIEINIIFSLNFLPLYSRILSSPKWWLDCFQLRLCSCDLKFWWITSNVIAYRATSRSDQARDEEMTHVANYSWGNSWIRNYLIDKRQSIPQNSQEMS